MTFGRDLVLRGARERLSPILMTSLATGLAVVPLVVLGDRPGHEIEYPLAVVILGGLLTSTLLNLFVVPSLYLRFGQSRRDRTRQPDAPAGRPRRLSARPINPNASLPTGTVNMTRRHCVRRVTSDRGRHPAADRDRRAAAGARMVTDSGWSDRRQR